jgi:hypothetical protein
METLKAEAYDLLRRVDEIKKQANDELMTIQKRLIEIQTQIDRIENGPK